MVGTCNGRFIIHDNIIIYAVRSAANTQGINTIIGSKRSIFLNGIADNIFGRSEDRINRIHDRIRIISDILNAIQLYISIGAIRLVNTLSCRSRSDV